MDAEGEDFFNVYEDEERARSYADLGFPPTYALAFRDLPDLFARHVRGRRALDFGCGAGRSSRFLKKLGFQVTGLDISEPMLSLARERDPAGDYRLVPDDGELRTLVEAPFDLILSALTFDNIPTRARRIRLLDSLAGLLASRGRFVNLVSAPELYLHEWVSLSPEAFPENRQAREGDRVRIVILDGADRRPVDDILWTDEGYRILYDQVGLVPVEVHKLLGRPGEVQEWRSETRISPWTIYVLRREGAA